MKLAILNNTVVADKYFLLEAACRPAIKKVSAGQFMHIRVTEENYPLLRRPLSIHDAVTDSSGNARRIKILYEARGVGTRLLSEKKKGFQIDAIGPLGNSFNLTKLGKYKSIYLVAGGMGVAPLFFLARRLKAVKRSKLDIRIFIGARSKKQLIRVKEFKGLGLDVGVATEDGSCGYNGMVTELMKDFLTKADNKNSVICACGPKKMLAVVAGIAAKNNIDAFVSLEEFMGCGLGACLGCIIKTRSGNKRICHDGPVFDASKILWNE